MRLCSRIERTLTVVAALTAGALLTFVVPLSAVTQSRDEQAGADVAQKVEAGIGIYRAPVTSEYVEAIGSRLVDNLEDTPFAFEFNIVDQFEPNAFALPGGWVYVSRGFLPLANSEDELAGVIGHEIIHITERHSSGRQRRGVLGAVLQVPGAVVGAVVGQDVGDLLNAPISTLSQLNQARYSRGQESESDRLGMRLAARSGYEPSALATILEALEADVETLTGQKHESSFFDSHPTTPDRVRDIHEEADDIRWTPRPPIASDRRDFLARLDGLWYDQNPEQGVFRDNRFYHADMGFTLTFPEGWTTVNTPSYVGAFADEQEAIALVQVAGDEEPSTYGARFVDRLREEHQTQPLEQRAVESDQWTGYYVTLQEEASRGGERSYLHYLWAQMGGVTFHLMAAGSEPYRPALREMALSLRPLADEDWESISALRLRVAEARQGETLAQLSERTGNQWIPEYTALINDLSVDQPLQAGTLVKIARREQYRPR